VVVEQVVVVLLLGHGLLCSSKKDQIYASMQSYQGGSLCASWMGNCAAKWPAFIGWEWMMQ
jgi:hypothetical protein